MNNKLNTYLVGGSVRDYLLNRPVADFDFVVVGATPQEMFANGFEQVGADFPVFLHPDSGSEFALARREKKTGEGYLGFTSDFGTDVTLVEDLGRRDLTINSMALTEMFVLDDRDAFDSEKHLVDPYNGFTDLCNKVLRHTSDAFEEDPVRVLRLARFRARMGPEWTVAKETRDLVHKMSKRGVLSELNADRIWKEMSRALMEPFPRLFFDTLLECDALHTIFPEVYRLKRALESHRWHPEGDAYEHTMLVLTQSAINNYPLETRYAALVHDLGKGLTPEDKLPSHFGHDVNGVAVVNEFSDRLRVPSKLKERAAKITRYHMNLHRFDVLNPKTFVKMFDAMNVMNDRDLVAYFYELGVCDERGRLGSEENSVAHLKFLFSALAEYASVKFDQLFPNGETNPEKIKQAFFRERTRRIAMRKNDDT